MKYVLAATPDASTKLYPGKVVTDFDWDDDNLSCLAVMPDGRIIAAGWAAVSGRYTFALARYNANGTPDVTFAEDGRLTTSFGGVASYGATVGLLADGRIQMGGYEYNHGDNFTNQRWYPVISRYTADGVLDNSLSSDGRVTFDGGSGTDMIIRGGAVQSDGKMLIVGGANSDRDTVLARFLPDGTPDTSFAPAGQRIIKYGERSLGSATVVQPDGKILVVGQESPEIFFTNFAAARLNPDGTLDTTFSGDGLASVAFGGKYSGSYGYCAALQDDGKILIAGAFSRSGIDFAVARLTSDGTLDTSFSDDGRVTTDFAGGEDRAQCIAVQPDGKILVGGFATDGGKEDFALVRYNPNGTLDTSFSGDGKLTIDFEGRADWANSIAVLEGGKILIAGGAIRQGINGADFALARVNPDGSLDLTFGGGENANTAPVITSFQGAPNATASVFEAFTEVSTISATDPNGDPLRYAITGGSDGSSFRVDPLSGALTFAKAPDFETPADADKDNVYEVIVSVSDGRGGSDAQTWTVEVINTQEVVRGSAGADQLVGTPLPEMIDGLDGDDRIAGLGGDDLLTGGSGIDSAVYSSPRSQYRVTEHGTKVSALSGGEGTDTLKEIERLVFSDSALAFDLAGHAGTVARYLGAVFGMTSVENRAYVGIGLRLLDQGVTNNDLMQLALESRLGATFTPAAEVELLYRNIAGRAPDAGELAYWSSELAHGDFDMVSLAQMAAGLDLNALNIGLAGLAQSGLPYDAA